jgi:hypothetical protein
MKLVELFGNWSPMCFNCAGQIGKLDPMPPTLPELRDALSRERRRVDRRIGRPDTRVFPRERRVGERRGTAEGLGLGLGLLGEDPIIEVVIDVDPDPNPDEITRIRAFAD